MSNPPDSSHWRAPQDADSPVEPPAVEPTNLESSPAEPPAVEPAAVEPTYLESSPAWPAYVEPAPVEPAPAEPPAVEPPAVEGVPAGPVPAPAAADSPLPIDTASSIEAPANAPIYAPTYAPPALPALPAATSGYPTQLTVTDARQLSRLWGIPLVGQLVRLVLVIPHLLLLAILQIGFLLVILLGWIPILLLGRVPRIQASICTSLLNRSARVFGYGFLLMPGAYPNLGSGGTSPVAVTINAAGRSMNRVWGIPLFGWIVRLLVTIPHFIVLFLGWIVGGLGFILLLLAILILGRYPRWAVSLYGGLLRYQTRIGAYLYLLPVPYPPFSFRN